MAFLVVKAWEKFQHYKDRDPPWIKLYRDTLTSPVWVMGTDTSRLVQLASTMLAARYSNKIPAVFDLWRKVANLDCKESQFNDAIAHLVEYEFLEIQRDEVERKQSASKPLATCTSEAERETETEAEERQNKSVALATDVGRGPSDIVRVFTHWTTEYLKPRAKLDGKRRKLIGDALKLYSPDDLCQSISGYKNSPHHMGRNDRHTVYDDIGLFLRSAKHIDAGLSFHANPPRTDLSEKTLRIVSQTDGWVPPELRNAVG